MNEEDRILHETYPKYFKHVVPLLSIAYNISIIDDYADFEENEINVGEYDKMFKQLEEIQNKLLVFVPDSKKEIWKNHCCGKGS